MFPRKLQRARNGFGHDFGGHAEITPLEGGPKGFSRTHCLAEGGIFSGDLRLSFLTTGTSQDHPFHLLGYDNNTYPTEPFRA